MDQAAVPTSSPEEVLTAQSGSPPPSRSSFIMNFTSSNRRRFLPAVLALGLLFLGLSSTVILVKQKQAPKQANCGEPGQPPCGSITVGCMAQCGALDIICGEGLECRDYAGNRHCFNASCEINEQIGCVCRTPSCTPTPPASVPCGPGKTCNPGETCCHPKVCNESRQCVEGTQFYCWGTSQCPNPGCSTNYDCEDHGGITPPVFPPTPTPTEPVTPSCDCFCDRVTADRNVDDLEVGDVANFTGLGKTKCASAIGKIKFVVSRSGTTVRAQEVSAALDRQEGEYQFYKASLPYTIESAGNYTVAIQVECPGGWED